jgi:1,2-diacylglycerol 3-alpha-glucosyltransferase
VRIVISGQTYLPAANGQAVFTARLAEGLAQSGHAVMVVVPSDRVSSYSVVRNGVRVEGLAAAPLGASYPDAYLALMPAARVRQLFDEFKPDVVHIQDHYPLSRRVMMEAQHRHLPVAGTNHFLPANIIHYINKVPWTRDLVERLLWWTMIQAYEKVDVVTTPTRTAASILRGKGLDVPVFPISCGVDLSRFRPMLGLDRAGVRAAFGLDPASILIMFVGRVDQEKRVDLLLEAVSRLHRQDIQLAVVGTGRIDHEIHEMAGQLGLVSGRQVVFTGRVPGEDLPRLLNAADLFAMPSEAELQSIATLEAMACGLPVLAADASALPELVTTGVNGFLFKPGDVEDIERCISRFADAPETWPAMGRASRARVRRHSLTMTLQRYVALYRSLVQHALRRPRLVTNSSTH